MPALRHLSYLHAWHLRLVLTVTSQSPSFLHRKLGDLVP